MKKTLSENYTKNRIYGIVGMVALFLMGTVFGFIINGSDRVNNSIMSEHHCNILASRIIDAANHDNPDLLSELNKVFSENCNNRNFRNDIANKPQPKPETKPEKLPDATCEAIEQLLKDDLADENSLDPDVHRYNSDIYMKLAKKGCEKNREMYQRKAQRESEIFTALYDDPFSRTEVIEENRSTCGEIERVLSNRLKCAEKDVTCMNASSHVEDAQIYANMSERGCPENSEKYKELAAQELEIARALTDDNIEQNKREATEMVETYKRLQMQAEATKMLDKAKRLTNPAIDFIIQLEKIIEE